MTKVIIIQGGSLDSYYEQTSNYLHKKYHTYPTNLQNLYVPQEQMDTEAMHERLARDTAANADINPNLPPGKIVL
jgi:hypothetical protein